jgi:hypothetical protein
MTLADFEKCGYQPVHTGPETMCETTGTDPGRAPRTCSANTSGCIPCTHQPDLTRVSHSGTFTKQLPNDRATCSGAIERHYVVGRRPTAHPSTFATATAILPRFLCFEQAVNHGSDDPFHLYNYIDDYPCPLPFGSGYALGTHPGFRTMISASSNFSYEQVGMNHSESRAHNSWPIYPSRRERDCCCFWPLSTRNR